MSKQDVATSLWIFTQLSHTHTYNRHYSVVSPMGEAAKAPPKPALLQHVGSRAALPMLQQRWSFTRWIHRLRSAEPNTAQHTIENQSSSTHIRTHKHVW